MLAADVFSLISPRYRQRAGFMLMMRRCLLMPLSFDARYARDFLSAFAAPRCARCYAMLSRLSYFFFHFYDFHLFDTPR